MPECVLVVCVCFVGECSGGTDSNACALLPESDYAVGAKHQRGDYPLGVLQQEPGEGPRHI